MKRILYSYILRIRNVALCCYQLWVLDCIRDKLIWYHVHEQSKNYIIVTREHNEHGCVCYVPHMDSQHCNPTPSRWWSQKMFRRSGYLIQHCLNAKLNRDLRVQSICSKMPGPCALRLPRAARIPITSAHTLNAPMATSRGEAVLLLACWIVICPQKRIKTHKRSNQIIKPGMNLNGSKHKGLSHTYSTRMSWPVGSVSYTHLTLPTKRIV